MTYRSYYTPALNGKRILNPNQTALLILKNSKIIAEKANNDTYTKFTMLETQIASISGGIFSSSERWALIEAMNELGWQVAICRDYWVFMQTSVVEHWPILNNMKILDLATTLRLTNNEKQYGPFFEAFKSFDITELSKFFYNEKELKEAVKATIEERLWEEKTNKKESNWEEQLKRIHGNISQIDIMSDDLNEYLRSEEFTIWEYLYYDLFKGNLIRDVFQLKTIS